jgi:hypothetical protein
MVKILPQRLNAELIKDPTILKVQVSKIHAVVSKQLGIKDDDIIYIATNIEERPKQINVYADGDYIVIVYGICRLFEYLGTVLGREVR